MWRCAGIDRRLCTCYFLVAPKAYTLANSIPMHPRSRLSFIAEIGPTKLSSHSTFSRRVKNQVAGIRSLHRNWTAMEFVSYFLYELPFPT